MSHQISWIHFGDLHIAGSDEQNHRDFLTLIDEANRYMEGAIDFALLPGDNADDGEEDEYQLVKEAVGRCRFPVHAIAGDHDVATGDLELFRRYLAERPHKSFAMRDHRFVFLNSVAHWHPPVFGLGDEQMNWLRNELHLAHSARERVVIFMHAYPSEHGADAAELRHLVQDGGVMLVEMGAPVTMSWRTMATSSTPQLGLPDRLRRDRRGSRSPRWMMAWSDGSSSPSTSGRS